MNRTPLAVLIRIAALSIALLAPAATSSGLAQEGTVMHAPSPGERVALVTGSTDGLGREVALRLGAGGWHVIVHGRNLERGREVVERIHADGTGSARFIAADLASFDEVRELARMTVGEYDRLDLLVNNAGVGPGAPGHERVITGDGHELRFQVNYLSHFLLTRLLFPLLRDSTPSRIVNVSSRSQSPIDLDDLRMEAGYSGGTAYGRSKLAQILFTFDLQEELPGTGVTAVVVHPAGAMDTDLVRETGGRPSSTVDEGAESVMRAITASEVPEGVYLHETQPRRAHRQAYDPEARARLRRISEDATGAPPLRTSEEPPS